jgi:hypothetical protein
MGMGNLSVNTRRLLLAALVVWVAGAVAAGAEPNPDLEAVEFWDTPEFKQASGRTEGIRGLDAKTLQAQRVALTPGVERILTESGDYLSLLFAPGVLPEGFRRDLIPLHSEAADSVRLPRFLHRDRLVQITVSSSSVDVTAYWQGKERVTEEAELRNMVLALARELFVREDTVIAGLKLSPGTRTTPYGLGGFLDPVLLVSRQRTKSDAPPLHYWLKGKWPEVIGFRTDGKTVSIGVMKPEPAQMIEGVGMRPRNEWFSGTETEMAVEAKKATQ